MNMQLAPRTSELWHSDQPVIPGTVPLCADLVKQKTRFLSLQILFCAGGNQPTKPWHFCCLGRKKLLSDPCCFGTKLTTRPFFHLVSSHVLRDRGQSRFSFHPETETFRDQWGISWVVLCFNNHIWVSIVVLVMVLLHLDDLASKCRRVKISLKRWHTLNCPCLF